LNDPTSRFAFCASWLAAPLLLAACSFSAAPAGAFSPTEIAAAAAVAREVEADVRWLADDALAGRRAGTAGGAQAAELLVDALSEIAPGLGSEAGRDAYRQPFDESLANLLAVIPGGSRAEEYVLVGAHYDHLGSDCGSAADTICNGATDNAAGVAVVLGIARAIQALPYPPDRSVVLALWDGEEMGLLGSKHYTEHPLVPLADLAAYVNFDIQGSNLYPSATELSFAVGAESGGATLVGITEESIAAGGLDTRLLSILFGQARSDYESFRRVKVPTVFLTDATNACYHTSADDLDVVDFRKLERQAEIGFRIALALAQGDPRPVFTPAAYLDRFEDLVTVSNTLTQALVGIDALYPSYQPDLIALEAEARDAVAAGPGAMQPTDALLLAQSALAIAQDGVPCEALVVPEPEGASVVALVVLTVMGTWAKRVRRGPASLD
jgi:hypothetical protein